MIRHGLWQPRSTWSKPFRLQLVTEALQSCIVIVRRQAVGLALECTNRTLGPINQKSLGIINTDLRHLGDEH